MTILSKADIMKATRLTRSGKLGEALALLCGTAGDMAPSADNETAKERNTIASGSFIPKLSAFLERTKDQQQFGNVSSLIKEFRKTIAAPFSKAADFGNYSFTNKAGTRIYKLYVPSGYDGRALPLVVMLHGCTQSPDDFAAGTRMNEFAEKRTFLVAYPAQPQSANVSKCWNWFNASHQQRDIGEPSIIAGLTRQIMQDFRIDAEHVYVAGLSAGGAAAAVMGAAYPDIYAAVGIHSGLACGAAHDVQSAFAAMRNGAVTVRSVTDHLVPTIVVHGDQDTTVNHINSAQIIEQARASANLETDIVSGTSNGGVSYTRTVQTNETGRLMLEQWMLHGAGHAWSGGSTSGSFTDPEGPDASQIMLDFFFKQKLDREYIQTGTPPTP
jgi:poly(hydroxyalkanoate) depolymerase family esterase